MEPIAFAGERKHDNLPKKIKVWQEKQPRRLATVQKACHESHKHVDLQS